MLHVQMKGDAVMNGYKIEKDAHNWLRVTAPDGRTQDVGEESVLYRLLLALTPPATQAEPKVYERNLGGMLIQASDDTRNPAVADRRKSALGAHDTDYHEGRDYFCNGYGRRTGDRARWVGEDSGMRNSDGSVPDGAIYASVSKRMATPPSQPAAEVPSLLGWYRDTFTYVKTDSVTHRRIEELLAKIDAKLRELDKRRGA